MILLLMINTKSVIEKVDNNYLIIFLENNKKTLILLYGVILIINSLKYSSKNISLDILDTYYLLWQPIDHYMEPIKNFKLT